MTPTNSDRAEWARQSLELFQELTGADDYQTAMGDLLADLMHFARLGVEGEELCFSTALSSAEMHYNEEVIEDPDE